MTSVGVHEAKTHLSRLLQKVEAGEEVIITRSGTPVARIVSAQARPVPVFGIDRGRFEIPDDFDETEEDVIAAFEESEIEPQA